MQIEITPERIISSNHLVLDFTGTLSCDGVPVSGVAERVEALSHELTIHVLTADTFGRAAQALHGWPVEVQIIRTGEDKAEHVRRLGGSVVVIGNGRNDVPMFRAAVLSIAVIGPEGVAAELFQHADIVVRDIKEGLDLLNHSLRAKATLRD